MTDLLITNVRPDAGATANILIENGLIAAVGPNLAPREGMKVVDGNNAIAIAPFVEAHVHLDKILWGLPWHSINVPDSLRAMIDNEVEIRRTLPWSVQERAGNLIRQCVVMGSTHIRSHVDISPNYKLDNLHGVLEAWERTKHAVDLEVVAFPQLGMLVEPGTAELMEAALDEGASIIGGIDPARIDGDPACHLDTIFDIAHRKQAKIDIHLHERGELGLYEIGLIAERTKALGMQGRVIVSHAFCLGTASYDELSRAIDQLTDAGIGIISAVPGDIPVPPLFELADRGVRCAIASIRCATPGTRTAMATCSNAAGSCPGAATAAPTRNWSLLSTWAPGAAPTCSASTATGWSRAATAASSWSKARTSPRSSSTGRSARSWSSAATSSPGTAPGSTRNRTGRAPANQSSARSRWV